MSGEVLITKLPIPLLVGMFVFYIITHLLIATYSKKLNTLVFEKPGNIETENLNKIMLLLNKWYSALYVIVVIVVFYNL